MIKRRGSILIVTLLLTAVIAAMTLLLAREARVELFGARYVEARAQAEVIADGAAEAVMRFGDTMSGAATAVGDGTFWIANPNYNNTDTYAWGILDESAKLDLNTATREQLLGLPWMTEIIASSIIDWRDGDDEPSADGAESDYYLTRQEPYQAKNAPFETVGELLLVRDVTPEAFFGEDANRNGILDPYEDDGDLTSPPDNRDGQLDRGLIDFVTVYARRSDDGRFDVNENDQTQDMRAAVIETLGEDIGGPAADAIAAGRPHRNLIDVFYKSQLEVDQFDQVVGQLRVGNMQGSAVNVNSAPREVLIAVSALEESEVDALIAVRQARITEEQPRSTGLAWITQTLERERAIVFGDGIIPGGDVWSADIIAVAPDGRAFERYTLVYEQNTTQRLHWQRMTHLGWPLNSALLEAARAGASADDLADVTDGEVF